MWTWTVQWKTVQKAAYYKQYEVSNKARSKAGIKNMSKKEAEALWYWMKALWDSKKLKPYQPKGK